MLNKRLSKTDVIDFDYFVSDPLDNDEERRLFLNHIEPELSRNKKQKWEQIIALWVQTKRNNNSKLSPGRIFHSGTRFIFFIFALSGLVTGMMAALSYLSYSGTEPVNIAIYLFAFVVSQIFFQILSLITLISSRFNLFSDFFSSPHSLVLLLIKKTVSIASGKLPADKRMGMGASIGKIKINKETFGGLYFWTIFKIFQVTGLMFGTGVLISTLFKVITSDLAFGWQTTIQTAPEKIFDIVRYAALPWSWMMSPGTAYPDLNNIEGSQILLKDGIVNLVSSDMAAWWPFLCFAVIFYTILPRLLFIFAGTFFEKRMLKKILSNNSATDRLLQILTTPLMVFERAVSTAEDTETPAKQLKPNQNKNSFTPSQTVVALIPEDIFSEKFICRLKIKASKNIGNIVETIEVTGDIDTDHTILRSLKETIKPNSSGDVLIVYESWMPPIKETLNYIKSIRSQTAKKNRIVIWLSGKPFKGNDGQNEVSDADYNIWKLKIQAMGEPGIAVIRDNE